MNRDEAFWRELGLWPRWVARSVTAAGRVPYAAQVAPVAEGVCQGAEIAPEGMAAVSRFSWDELGMAVADCRRCVLHEKRHQAVLGTGDRRGAWLVVGEAPGAEEDQRGEPFVGAAGRLLDQMLRALDLQRGHNVYIANAIKCRPPGNRTPMEAECAACRPFLERQIALIEPRLIVLLGRVAAHGLLGGQETLAVLRQQVRQWNGIPVVVSWHPAYLLRNPADKARAWEDLCRARRSMVDLAR